MIKSNLTQKSLPIILAGLMSAQPAIAENTNVNLSSSIQNVNTRVPGFILSEGPSLRNALIASKGNFRGTLWTDTNTETGKLTELDIIGCYNNQISKKVNIGGCAEQYRYPSLGFETENYTSVNGSYTSDDDITLRLTARHFLGNNTFEDGEVYQLNISKPVKIGDFDFNTSAEIVGADNFFGANGLTVGRIQVSDSYQIDDDVSINGFIQQQIRLNDNFTNETIVGIGLNYSF